MAGFGAAKGRMTRRPLWFVGRRGYPRTGLPGGGGGSVFSGQLKNTVAFPIGQAIPDGYAANDTNLPFAAAQAQFDAVTLENRTKPNQLYTITNSGVLLAERVFSATAANTDIAASFAPLGTIHTFSDPTREPTNLTVSSTSGATNYWKDVLTQRVTSYATITGFSSITMLEMVNEIVVPGGYAASIFKTAAAGDGTWTLAPELYFLVIYDALVALGQTHDYAIGEFALDDGGRGVGVDPPVDPAGTNKGLNTARKRPQFIKLLQDTIAGMATKKRITARLQGHFDSVTPFYLSELLFFLDELTMLRCDVAIGELNTQWTNVETLFASLTTTAQKRLFASEIAAYMCLEVARRNGLKALHGWTGFPVSGRTPITIMEAGKLSELGKYLGLYLNGLPAAAPQKRAQRILGLGSAAEVNAIPGVSGATNVGAGASGTGGAFQILQSTYKQRTADNATVSTVDSTNCSRVIGPWRVRAVTSGVTIFDEKDGGSATFCKAVTTGAGTIDITLDGTTTNVGAYAVGDLLKFVIDHNGTTSLKCVMGRRTSGGVVTWSPILSKASPAATQVVTTAFPDTTDSFRVWAHQIYYDTSRLASDGLMISEADPTPDVYVTPAVAAAPPVLVLPAVTGTIPSMSAMVGTLFEAIDLSPVFTPIGAGMSYSISPALPGNMTFTNGVIDEIVPDTTLSATTYTVTAYDSRGYRTSSTFSLTVAAAAVNAAPVGGNITLNFDVLAGTVPANTVAPSVSGTATVGQVLTTTNGTWSNGANSFTRKWQTSANGTTGWADISGATAATYTLVSGDLNQFIRSLVTGSNLAGAGTAAPSAATAQIASGFSQPALATATAGTAVTTLAETQTIRNFCFAGKWQSPETAANSYIFGTGVDSYFRVSATAGSRLTFRVKEKGGNTQFINSNPIPVFLAANTLGSIFCIAYDDGTNYTWSVVLNGTSFASGSGASPGADWFVPSGMNRSGAGSTGSTDCSLQGFWFGQAASLPGTKPTYSDFFDGAGDWKDIFGLSTVAGFTPSAKWGGSVAALNALGITTGTFT